MLSSSFSCSFLRRWISRYFVIVSGFGFSMTRPVYPSRMMNVRDLMVMTAASMPTMAGIPSDLERMAVCELMLPCSVMNPMDFCRSMVAVADGVRSNATMMCL